MTREEHIHLFVSEIWNWFSVHKRALPWRDLSISNDTERAYQILVSEIMLQQTQVPRVIIVFKRFLEQFPTLDSLANASNKDVIVAWQGMGYNSRALRLRDACITVAIQYNGNFPREMDQLQSIKGIGNYTAGAMRNFAFQIPTPCIDTNIRRILNRTFIGPENVDGTWRVRDKELLVLAAEVLQRAIADALPGRTTADWHAALMDFGSLVCTKTNPKWDMCPLTAKGLMKAAHKVPKLVKKQKKEPGREVAGKFIPNRIFRGRIVEELRAEHAGLTLEEIGRRISVDWDSAQHREWLQELLEKLKTDMLLRAFQRRYMLQE